MNRSKVEILKEEIVLPEVVVAAAEDAFDKILREASMEKVEKMEVACMKSRKPIFKKRWVALVAVAALVVGTLSVGAATGGFDEDLLKFIGVESIQPGDLKVASKKVDATFVSQGTDYLNLPEGEKKDVPITITEVMGDETTAYFRVDIDYDLPKDFSLERYALGYEYGNLKIYNDPEMTEEAGFPEDVWGKPIYEDGKVSYMYRISGLDNVGEKYFHWEWNNLYMFDMETMEGDVVFEGKWDMKFQLAYESEEPIVLNPDLSIAIQDAEFADKSNPYEVRSIRDIDVEVSEIVITPLSIHLEGVAPFDPNVEQDLFIQYSLDKITYKDGTVMEYDYSDFKGRDYKYNATLQSYYQENNVFGSNNIPQMFGKGIDLEKIESITINGVEIKVK